MIQFYTTEDLLSYLYNETCASINEEIHTLLKSDQMLKIRMSDLLDKMDSLKSIPLKRPSEGLLKYIRNYAADTLKK